MTELLVGTKKGLFVLQGEPGHEDCAADSPGVAEITARGPYRRAALHAQGLFKAMVRLGLDRVQRRLAANKRETVRSDRDPQFALLRRGYIRCECGCSLAVYKATRSGHRYGCPAAREPAGHGRVRPRLHLGRPGRVGALAREPGRAAEPDRGRSPRFRVQAADPLARSAPAAHPGRQAVQVQHRVRA